MALLCLHTANTAQRRQHLFELRSRNSPCDEEPSASLPGALALTLPCSSLSGGLGRTGAGPRLAVLQPSGGRTPVTEHN